MDRFSIKAKKYQQQRATNSIVTCTKIVLLEQHFLVLTEAYNLVKMLLVVRTSLYIDVFLFHGHFESTRCCFSIDISVEKHVTTKDLFYSATFRLDEGT